MYAQFGSAGNPDAFYQAGHKASAEMPAWLEKQSLGAYEYQCSRGVTIREETARIIGRNAKEYGVALSIHAPYYINLSTQDDTIAENTRKHILKSLQVAQWMGADRVTFHIGGPGKQPRSTGLDRAKRLFSSILDEAEKNGLTDIYLAPETMGKQNQLGNLDEVVDFCKISPRLIPAVDFGHLHAASLGGYQTKEEFAIVFDKIVSALGEEVASKIHVHFSKIEFTKAGEKRHWTFADDYGPPHEPFLELIADRGYAPRVICESAGTQAMDAKLMQDFYLSYLNNGKV